MSNPQIEKIRGKINIVFSASGIDLFQLCHARYDMSHNKRKTLPIYEKADSLDFGSLAHNGLEVYYKALAEGAHYNDRMQKTLSKIKEIASNPEESNVDNTEDLNMVLNAVEQSCDYWRSEDENFEILGVESPFDYVLYEDDDIRIIISGKIDLLVNQYSIGRNVNYTNLPYDHKTSQRDSPIFRLSNQFINYCAVTKSNFLIVNKIGLQKTVKAQDKFKRVPLSYDPLIIQEWKDNITKMILNEYLTCVSTGHWTMNFTSCMKFNRLCEFSKVCDSSGKEAKLFKLERNYVENKKWDKYEKGSDS